MAIVKKDSSVYDPLAMAIAAERKTNGPRMRPTKTCIYWTQGRCNRTDCRFMHSEQPAQKTKQFLAPKTKQLTPKTKQMLANKAKQLLADHLNVDAKKRRMTWRNDSLKKPSEGEVNVIRRPKSEPTKEEVERSGVENTQPKETCVNRDKLESFHTLSHGAGVTKVAQFKGHDKAITGIALPSGSGKLYTMSKDKYMRSWDCQTGQCGGTELLNAEVDYVITRSPWVFAGLQNNVKAWNLHSKVEFSFNLTGGQVRCMEFDNDILFAGMEDGSISVWRRNPDTNDFKLAATMKGHNGPVTSLIIGSGHGKLYLGSTDCNIKVWNQQLQCIQTLQGHTREVTSLLCYDKYLLTASIDMTLKVWSEAESGSIEMVYERKEDHGFVSMGSIINGPESQHILVCSLVDNTVRLYDFPSFVERGRICSEAQASVIQVGVEVQGLFFIGDEAGEVSVWRLA